MATERQSMHGQWSKSWVFVLAATGAAVGLGNIWKFPYIAGTHGGGAFVLIYLVCIAVIGIPLLMAEILRGRRGCQNSAHSIRDLALDSNKSRYWQIIGWISILSGFLILSYYSVVSGWTVDYAVMSLNNFTLGKTPHQITGVFDTLYASGDINIFWLLIFVLMTVGVVYGGV